MAQVNVLVAIAAFLMLIALIFAIVGVASTDEGWYSCDGVNIGTLQYSAGGGSADLQDGDGCDADTGGSTTIAFSIFAMLTALVSLVCGCARAVGFGPEILSLVAAATAGATSLFELICWLTMVIVISGECDGKIASNCAPDYAWALCFISFIICIPAAILFFIKRSMTVDVNTPTVTTTSNTPS